MPTLMQSHRAIVNVNVIYVHDAQMFRVFLARADMFPPGSLVPVAHGNLAALINPALLGNVAPANLPLSVSRPQVEPVEGIKIVKQAKILRPPNAFILYRKAHHEAVKAAHPGIHNNQICKFPLIMQVTHINFAIAVILGTQWQKEDAGVRAQYKAQAAQLKHEHMKKHPDYQYQPRKASELKRRMTKKKAAALSQDKALAENLDTGSSPSDHDFSGVPGNWISKDTSVIMPGCNTTALFDQVDHHNTQQQAHQYLEGSFPEVSVHDSLYQNLFFSGPDAPARERTDMDDFEDFINADIWSVLSASS